MTRNSVLIFHSIHRVMQAEKCLKDAGFDVRLLPVPRELSSDCGLSLAFVEEQWEKMEVELSAHGCMPEEMHVMEQGHYQRRM